MNILKKVRENIIKNNLIKKRDKLILGVSGGPDSIALLLLLNSLKKEFKLSLFVAHLDHMLREGSSKDAKFVIRMAEKLKLPVTVGKVNINALSRDGGSLEESAREERLKFFFKVARKNKAKKIALGHNLDDQAETVLMRIIRGSGMYGLSGILPKREICGYEIIRPLIGVTRKEINSYLKYKKIKPRIDASNYQNIYFRNRIRNRLIPLLEKEYNSNIKKILSNTAQTLAYDYDYLVVRARRIAESKIRTISLKKLAAAHPAMRRLIFRLQYMRLKGDLRRLTFRHIQEIEDCIARRPLNSIVFLPKGISVVKKEKSITFRRK